MLSPAWSSELGCGSVCILSVKLVSVFVEVSGLADSLGMFVAAESL